MLHRDGQRGQIASGALSRVLDGETIILDLDSGTYFGLNVVGTRIWELIGSGEPLGGIRDRLLAEFDISKEVAQRDLDDLIDKLLARGLITLTDE